MILHDCHGALSTIFFFFFFFLLANMAEQHLFLLANMAEDLVATPLGDKLAKGWLQSFALHS